MGRHSFTPCHFCFAICCIDRRAHSPAAILVALPRRSWSLCEQSGSGYELARRFDRSIGYFWAPRISRSTRTLRTMGRRRLGDRDGGGAARAAGQEGLHGVPAGRAELAERWIADR